MKALRPYSIGVSAVLGLVALSLAACGGGSTPTTVPPTNTPTSSAPTATTAPGMTENPTMAPTQGPTATPSFDAAAFFKGKTVRIVVGFAPGGGTDTQARFLAQRLGQYVPGNPKFIVSNITPSVAAGNYVFKAPDNPITLLYNATPMIIEEAQSAAQYRISKMYIIGAAVSRDATWMIRGNLPYNTISDVLNQPNLAPPVTLTISASLADLSGATQLAPLLAADDLGLPISFKPSAQTGTNQTLLEVQRGDVNSFIAGSVWYQMPERQPDWIPNNYVKPFAIVGGDGATIGPNSQGSFNAPNIYSLLKTDQQKQIWDTMVTPDTFVGKNLMAGPNIPMGAIDALRKAWSDANSDPQFQADYEKLLGQPADLANQNGAQLQQQFDKVESAFLANKDQVQTIEQQLFSKYVH